MALIDLDQPQAAPPPRRRPRWLRRRPIAAGLALLLAGGVAGGLAGERWGRLSQQRAADRSAVSVVLLPDPVPEPDDRTVAAPVVDAAVVRVELTGHVVVVNAGPAPVRFVGFRADRPGLELRGEGRPGADTIGPGAVTRGIVHATVTCAARPPGDPVAAVLDVESADGVRRRPTVVVEWRAWSDRIAAVCAAPPPTRRSGN